MSNNLTRRYKHKAFFINLTPSGKRVLRLRVSYSFSEKKLFLRSIGLTLNGKSIGAEVKFPQTAPSLEGIKRGFSLIPQPR